MKPGAVLALIALGGCAPAASSSPPPRPAAHPTLVSLNPCTDAVLAEVADAAQIAALSHYSRDPAASSMDVQVARRLPATGGTVEELAVLAPDIVIGDDFTAPATRAALAGLGLRLETLGIAHTVAESEAQVRRIAALAGHPERGAALVARIEAALAANSPRDAARPAALVWQAGGLVPGANTLIADLLARTGFANFAAARGLGQADVLGLEAVIADPPRVILAAGAGDPALAHPVLAELENTTRVPFQPSLLYCGGPTIIRAAERLANIRRSLRPRAGGDLRPRSATSPEAPAFAGERGFKNP